MKKHVYGNNIGEITDFNFFYQKSKRQEKVHFFQVFLDKSKLF